MREGDGPADRGIDGSRGGMGMKNEEEEEDVLGGSLNFVCMLGRVGVFEGEGEMQEMVRNS